MATDPERVGRALASLLGERSAASVAARAKSSAGALSESTISKMLRGRALTLANVELFLDGLGASFYDLARALDEVNGRAVAPVAGAAPFTIEALRAAFPGAPRDLLARARVLLAEKDLADSKLDQCIEEIREAATRGSA